MSSWAFFAAFLLLAIGCVILIAQHCLHCDRRKAPSREADYRTAGTHLYQTYQIIGVSGGLVWFDESLFCFQASAPICVLRPRRFFAWWAEHSR